MSQRVKHLIIYLVVMVGLTLVRIAVNEGFLGGNDTAIDNIFTLVTQILCMGLIPILGMYFVNKSDGLGEIKGKLNIKKPIKGSWWCIALIAVLHVIIIGGVSTVWSMALDIIGYTRVVSDGTLIYTFGQLLFALLMSAILPAVFEEITHRGLVLYSTTGNIHKRALMSALTFALMHQNIMQTGYTFVGGLIMAYCVLYTGSILPGIIIHFVNNALVQIRLFSSANDGFVAKIFDFIYSNMDKWWFFIILTIVWVGAVVGVFFIIKHLKNKSESADICCSEVEVEKDDTTATKWLWIAIIAFGVITTLFSLIWGLIR